jgi:hypothetical protein
VFHRRCWLAAIAVAISLVVGCADDNPASPPPRQYSDAPITSITSRVLDDLLVVRPLVDTSGYWRVFDINGCQEQRHPGRISQFRLHPYVWGDGSDGTRRAELRFGAPWESPGLDREFGYKWDIRSTATLEICCHKIPLTNVEAALFCGDRTRFRVISVTERTIVFDDFRLVWTTK